jgi:hypothetical protein
MPTEQEGDLKPSTKTARDRSVSDVAREAFENSLIEGDREAVGRKPGRKTQPGQRSGQA